MAAVPLEFRRSSEDGAARAARGSVSAIMNRLCHRGLLGCLLLLSACGGRGAEVQPPGQAVLSLLLVGDTGRRADADPKGVRLAVGRALAREDQRLPATRLLLLGDNFYPQGLLADELVPRVRENLVRPFCHFLRLDGPRSTEVADACSVPAGQRHPIPIEALLGNHDHEAPDSGALQRTAVPSFLPGWRIPPGPVHLAELGHGVSLLLLDSQSLYAHPAERLPALAGALRAATGRFRIVVAHHPPADLDPDGNDAAWMDRATARVREALARVGAPVQLWVSGHEHNLQLLAGGADEPRVIAVAGSGSDPRHVRTRRPRIFASDAPGFARVDLVETRGSVEAGRAPELVVTLFEADVRTGVPRARASVRIGPDGSLLGVAP